MMYILLCLVVFLACYCLNLMTITLGYHRGLAHDALRFHPRAQRLLVALGPWITGLDPKAWATMHRRHHAFSDTERDPHSPQNVGLVGIPLAQLRSYEATLRGLARRDPEYISFAEGLDFELSWLNTRRLWWLPYVAHGALGLTIAVVFGAPLLGACTFFGLMSHPVQGGLVNAFGHAVGGRNFEIDDASTNNALVAWLVMGEGYQNNHHAWPDSAKFSYRPWEVDLGFGICLALESVGVLRINYEGLIPESPRAGAPAPASS